MNGVKFVKFVKFVGVVLLVGVVLAQASGQMPAVPATAGFEREEGVRFMAVDVVVDSRGVGLGAYQIEVRVPMGMEIVGLEGGEGVFADAPFYDPKALMGQRIVVAAFSTEEEGKLPHGAGRVARLHLMIGVEAGGTTIAELDRHLVVATDSRGETIPADVTLKIFEGAK